MSPTSDTAPLVRVVVLNFEGGDLTIDCLRGLVRTDWPVPRLEIVLVDNASTDGVADRVERELPVVRVVRSETNRGFAGGCNLGLRDLGAAAYVALVNNDATVEPGWLRPLVDALEQDPELGAACPKILFADSYRALAISAPTHRRGRGDDRALGVHVSGARVDGLDVWPRVQLVSGWWGDDPGSDGQWTDAEAVLRLPSFGGAASRAELRIRADAPGQITVGSGPTARDVEVGVEARWAEVPFDGPDLTIVNNAGNVLTDDHQGADRGIYEVDDGQLDTPADVFAWCGAAVLLRREYLDDVGLFDERLFLYYEDFELAWRGRERGWRYRYVPASVVRHVHSATVGVRSAIHSHLGERNRLLTLARHDTPADARRALFRYLAATASYARRDVVSPLLRGDRPHGEIVGRRVKAFGAALVRLPAMLRSRRDDHDRAPRE